MVDQTLEVNRTPTMEEVTARNTIEKETIEMLRHFKIKKFFFSHKDLPEVEVL